MKVELPNVQQFAALVSILVVVGGGGGWVVRTETRLEKLARAATRDVRVATTDCEPGEVFLGRVGAQVLCR